MQIASIRVLHDDVQIPLIGERLLVRRYIWVVQLLQDLGLEQSLFSLLGLHGRDLDDFHHVLQSGS